MSDKWNDIIEKGLTMVNNKKARYNIHKAEQQKADKPETNTPITVISYRVFPESGDSIAVKNDASETMARQFLNRKSSRSAKIACFFGGALFATVLATAIFATCFSVIAPFTRIEGNYCYIFTGNNQFELLTLEEVKFWDGSTRLRNMTFGLFLSQRTLDSLDLVLESESERIKLNSDTEYRKKTFLARELSAILGGKTSRSNNLSTSISEPERANDEKHLDKKCTGFIPQYQISIHEALNWIVWMQQNNLDCLVNLAPFLNNTKFTLPAQSDKDSSESTETDSGEEIPNED